MKFKKMGNFVKIRLDRFAFIEIVIFNASPTLYFIIKQILCASTILYF